MLRRLFMFGCMLTTVGATGCTSISSTLLTRNESNTGWDKHACLTGVPITLKVPTHVKVYIMETYYLQAVTDGGVTRTERLKLPFTVRDLSQEFIYTEKIFTVDFKRPAGGSFNLRLDMTKDQYIQNVQHDVTDQTIQNVGGLLKQLAPGGIIPQVAGDATTDAQAPINNLKSIKSIAAVGIFEIDAPDFEQQLTQFINCHLTQAHDAWTTAPGVKSIHRVPFAGYDQDSDLCRGQIVPFGVAAPVTNAAPPGGALPSNAFAPQAPPTAIPQVAPAPGYAPAAPVIQSSAAPWQSGQPYYRGY